jgi:hypothetical protein
VDELLADYIREYKTRWSAFDYEKYHNAHQWRWYLLNFGAAFVEYLVFCWSDNKGGFKLNGIEKFKLYPYDGMEAECLETLGELVEYIQRKGLGKYVADNHPRLMRGAA